MEKGDRDVKKESNLLKTISKKGNSVALGMAVWAGIVTISLIVIVAVVYRRIKSQRTGSSAESVYSDAESGSRTSSFDYDRNSVVDMDSNCGDGQSNGAYAEEAMGDLPDSGLAVPAEVKQLDSELNEKTLRHIAGLHEDGDDDDEDAASVAEVHGSVDEGNHLTTSRHQFRHAPFKGLHVNENPGGSSFL